MSTKPQKRSLCAALLYARLLGPVFATKPRSKDPLSGSHGYKDGTVDEKVIRQMWAEHPTANVAVVTGVRVWVLDVDPRHGGDKSLERLEAKHGKLGAVRQFTGGGGLQYFFAMPDGVKIGCRTAVLPGIDVRGKGGYVLTPPSIHPDTGKAYFWDGPLQEQKVDLAPAWVLEELHKRKNHREKNVASGETAAWIEGSRNTRLFSLAGKLRYDGLGVESILPVLRATNAACCVPLLPEDEVEKIARSIGRYAAGRGHFARMSVDAAESTIKSLNNLELFAGHVCFEGVERRGSMIVARFTDGAEAIWHSLADLTSFARSQSIIAEATRVLIPTPPRRSIKAEWEAAVQILLNLAGKDQTMSPHKTREEFSEILRIGWEQAGYPVADSDEEFLRLLRLCYTQPRDPRGPSPECTVWHDNSDCFVHQMTLINWLSTPSGRHHHYEWGEVRDALFLLNFVPQQVHRSVNKEHAKVRLWRGPLEILVADETGE